MVNFLQKLYSKWISPPKEENPLREKMVSIIDKNHHYGFLIETIVLKLKLMQEDFQKQDYKFLEKDLETLDILITKGTELLEILEKEDSENHLRSKIYLDKQTNFFNMLNVMLPELFY